MNDNPLFRTFGLKSLTLPNRVVMAPMTRYFSPDGQPTQAVVDYYRRRAEGQVGLIVTEGVGIDRPAARNHPDIPHFHGRALDAWARTVEEVHGAGGRIAPQLWHVGSAPDLIHQSKMPDPAESPSGLFSPDMRVGEVMGDSEIEAVVAAFAKAAADAKRIGFDCIEFHAAHGYLFDQFFWPTTNLRTDRYGGRTIADRVRFAVEVVRATRRAVGEDFVIIMRISQWKQQDYEARVAETPQELEQWLTPLADAGVDIFHCSQRRYWEPEFDGSPLNLAGWAKKLTGKATITVGSVGLSGEFMATLTGEVKATTASLDDLMNRLDRGEFDLVAVGRALLSDPQWLIKVRDGRQDDMKAFDVADVANLY
jgi:2,4-dienoyl-CoA reductase-like NADH-dependent reductase (Old Yellow Enzyme family)